MWLCIYDIKNEISTERIEWIMVRNSLFIETYAWSPDGSKIVFNKGGGLTFSDLFILDVSSKQLRQITDGGYNYEPKWTPDGKNICFTKLDIQNNDYNGKVYIFNLGKNEIKELVHFNDNERFLSLSIAPNGRECVYFLQERKDSSLTCNIYKYNFDEEKSYILR
jgi:Tol biopolymer transport system component